MQNMETTFVGGIPCAFLLHAAKWSHRDRPVILTTPGTAPVFKLHQFTRRLFDKILYNILVT